MHKNKHPHHSEYDLYHDFANVKGALSEATHNVRGRAGEIFSHSYENIKGKSAEIKDNVEEYVGNKPFQTIGIAFLAGVVIGFLMRK